MKTGHIVKIVIVEVADHMGVLGGITDCVAFHFFQRLFDIEAAITGNLVAEYVFCIHGIHKNLLDF